MSLLLKLVIKTGKKDREKSPHGAESYDYRSKKKMILENKNGKLLHKKVRRHAI